MTTRDGGTNWTVVGVVAAVGVSVVSGFWSIANPRDDIKGVEARVSALKNEEVKQLRDDLKALRDELRWSYTNKEENKTYREGIERIVSRIETKANTLDSEIHSTYSSKDALAQIQMRIVDIERALRTQQSKPDVQINPVVNNPTIKPSN